MSLLYQEKQLDLGPSLYWRCDRVGAASEGDEITDLSGNDIHGELSFAAGGGEPYGFASPVETDESSRAIRIFQNVFPFNHAFVECGSESEIEPAGDFALIAFLKPEIVGQILLGKQGLVGPGLDGYCFKIGIDANGRFYGSLIDSAHTVWTVTVPLIADQDERLNIWWHCALVRVANALIFYINGLPQAQITITSGLPTLQEAGPFRLGAPISGVFASVQDEIAICTEAPTANEILELFEASRAINDMFIVINGRSSFTIDSTEPATYAFFPYSHDFTNPLAERLSRLTEIHNLKDGAESRSGKMTRTRRTLSVDVVIQDARARRQFKSFLRNNQRKPVAWPITQYETELTAEITAGQTTFFLDTVHKDFDIGNRLAIFTSEFDYELFEIVDMDEESVTVSEPAVSDWPITAVAVPCLRATLEQNVSLEGITNEDYDASLTVNILVEDIVESPNRVTPYTPVYTYRGVEVFDPFEFELNDYSEPSEDDSTQQSEVLDARTGIFRIDSDNETSQPGFGYTTQLEGLEQISRFLGWYERRQGALVSLWLPTMQDDFNVVSMDDDEIVITETDYFAQYALADDRVDIALIQDDGTVEFRRITAVEQGGDNEVLTVNASVTDLAETTEQVCFLLMCRLDADDVMMEWITNDYVEVSMKFREVPKEVV